MVNPLPGNPHAEPANYADIEATPYTQAQATLAIAYEMRTANLIALYTSGDVTHGEVTYGLLPERAEEILKRINERLNLQVGGEVK
jgi:hypothetical protein